MQTRKLSEVRCRMKDSSTKGENKFIKKIAAILFWLIIWQIASMVISEEVLLVSPLRVFNRLLELLPEGNFWKSIFSTLWKITLGLILALVFGTGFAYLSYKSEVFNILFHPAIVFFRSIPVASFVILILVWINSKDLSIYISFMMGMPIIYLNLYTGLTSIDNKLMEMANSFRVSDGKRIRYLYLHKLRPFFKSAMVTSAGLMFKAGIAAEVIGLPKDSIGENLYNAKIYLDMPDLFAWTITIIGLSMLYEKLILLIVGGGRGA